MIRIFFSFLIIFKGILVWAQDVRCPMGIGSLENEAPKILVEYEPQKYIFACGFSDDESMQLEPREGDALVMSGFEIYQQSEVKKPAKRIKTVAALDKHKIERSKSGLILTEIVKIGQTDFSTLESKINCTENLCTMTKQACLFKKLKDVSPQYLREFKRYFNGKKKDLVPSEVVIDRAARFALTGDRESIGLFLRAKPPVKLEGGAKEVYFKYQLLIKRLVENHCL